MFSRRVYEGFGETAESPAAKELKKAVEIEKEGRNNGDCDELEGQESSEEEEKLMTDAPIVLKKGCLTLFAQRDET